MALHAVKAERRSTREEWRDCDLDRDKWWNEHIHSEKHAYTWMVYERISRDKSK